MLPIIRWIYSEKSDGLFSMDVVKGIDDKESGYDDTGTQRIGTGSGYVVWLSKKN